MAATPAFANNPKTGLGQVSVANANRDGTGTLITLFTAGTGGSYLKSIRAKATVTTSAGMIRFFASVDAGTTKRLIAELAVSVVTPSASVAAFEGALTFNQVLAPSTIIYASTEKAEAINLVAEYGDY